MMKKEVVEKTWTKELKHKPKRIDIILDKSWADGFMLPLDETCYVQRGIKNPKYYSYKRKLVLMKKKRKR